MLKRDVSMDGSAASGIIKYYFIINPNAGKRKEQRKLRQSVEKACGRAGIVPEIYETSRQGDGGDFLVRTSLAHSGDGVFLRFYFCGGDGTVLEAANAFMRLPEELRSGRVAAGIIPVGTGNDFLRNFGTASDFLDIDRQLRAEIRFTDLMTYGGCYCANMFNIGFDCQVVVRVNSLRGRPYMTKKLAYPVGVAKTLVKLPHTRLRVEFDSGEVFEGRFLLVLAANGSYCGGGFRAASEAAPDDGIIDVIIVKPVGRLRFISIVGKYKKGKLLGTSLADKVLYLRKCKTVTFSSPGVDDVCVDGEIERFEKLSVGIAPKVFPFLVPQPASGDRSQRL